MTQFEFCSNLPEGELLDYSFGEWTRWHSDSYRCSSGEHDELEWLAKEEDIISSPRAQAIDRCRKEMIELVNDMPDDAFELSLKDLVELPRTARESPRKNNLRNRDEGKVKKAERKHCRNRSTESAGFLLKMFFLIPSSSLSGRKKKNVSKNCSRSTGSSKSGSNSTRPLMKDGRKADVDKSSEGKLVVKQPSPALRTNCSRNSLIMKGSANIFLRSIFSYLNSQRCLLVQVSAILIYAATTNLYPKCLGSAHLCIIPDI